MCGIVGGITNRPVATILLDGLKRLEYRGYDSAGIATVEPSDGKIHRLRTQGKVEKLVELLDKTPLIGTIGIAHTRWATHGEPSVANAHPHFSGDRVAVVHNGIIENHEKLRKRLTQEGYVFESQTDTEVIAHLIDSHLKKNNDPIAAIQAAIKELDGAYALGILIHDFADTIFAIRSGSPLVLGKGYKENFLASDPLALLPVTQNFVYLDEGDITKITRDTIHIWDKNGKEVTRQSHLFDHQADSASKGNYRHFMHKEIVEQPKTIVETIEGHTANNQVLVESFGYRAKEIFEKIKRVHIIACGTSYHAALVASYWLEAMSGIATKVEIASENRYRPQVIEDHTLFVALSQSGETADTLAALRQAKASGKYVATLGICNVPQSSLAREADLVFMMRAGTEIGVAATKTFSAQLVALLLLTLALGRSSKQLSLEQEQNIIKTLNELPQLMQKMLTLDKAIQDIAQVLADYDDAIFLGRGVHVPIAMEGALKLKEISYVHAEAYPAGELKHGPLALVDRDMPVIIIAPKDELSEKLASNIQEVEARNGLIFVFADQALHWENKGDTRIINVPVPTNILSPILYNLPLQLLAYHVAVLKGTDVDQPRNLAKSVTVE